MLDGLYTSGKSFQFLENYVIIETARAEDFSQLLVQGAIQTLIISGDK
jgi:hypothetical protein